METKLQGPRLSGSLLCAHLLAQCLTHCGPSKYWGANEKRTLVTEQCAIKRGGSDIMRFVFERKDSSGWEQLVGHSVRISSRYRYIQQSYSWNKLLRLEIGSQECLHEGYSEIEGLFNIAPVESTAEDGIFRGMSMWNSFLKKSQGGKNCYCRIFKSNEKLIQWVSKYFFLL